MKVHALRREQVAKLLHSSALAPLPQNVFATGQYALHQPLGSANWTVSSNGGSGGLAHNSISSVGNNALMLAVQAGASIASHTALQVLEQVNVITNVATLNQVERIAGALTTSSRNRSIAPAPATVTAPSPLPTTVNPVASKDQAALLQRKIAKRKWAAQFREEQKKKKQSAEAKSDDIDDE
jgi:hypothetical protein